jgi:hypothetical protein
MSIDWIHVVEQLLLHSWLSLALGAAVTAAMGYFTARHRYKNVRVTTHAYLGGAKGFETRNEADIDGMFRCFETYDTKVAELIEEFNRSKGGARVAIGAHILSVAERMIEECEEMLRTNIAFRTLAGHQQFLDQIDNRRSRAIRLRGEAQRVQQVSRGADLAAVPSRRAAGG